ncbi:putative Syn8 snare [Polychaeton citri CBS 116435]|uniref:Syn8 snare n=1 Tax=Polychaeton citri CBS 116435 TaxID=1314669 RepID=A0A9P4Q1H1_9PEZI|nr:putative Syn8 snare [Polychaeton citri CBS 116435]
MASSSPRQLFLLADHLKLSLLERQRAQSLSLPASQQDSHIQRSLSSLEEGIEALDIRSSTEDPNPDLDKLRKQYHDLYAQFHGSAPPSAETATPNDARLSGDFAAAQSRPSPAAKARSKNVRFQQDSEPYRDDPQEAANRAALFDSGSGGGYRDQPEGPPDQSHLDNQQIHAFHKQVLRDQDEQLDALGASIGRQRILGNEMNRELVDQIDMIDDVEAGVDRHMSTLDRARNRLGHVARKSKDNWSWVTIGILIVVLVLLIIVLK